MRSATSAERLDPEPTRLALVSVLRQAKRNKAFDNSRFIGLAIDGTGTSRSRERRCELCRPRYNGRHEVCGYSHHLSLITVAGTGLSLPFDVEPYGPGDSEYSASRRLLERAVHGLGARFADYVVVDGEYATAPFLHTACALGLHPVARLKNNLPDLLAAATARFATQAPTSIQQIDGDRVELWDADDFDPWQELRWPTVRVLRYRQCRPDGSRCEAYWLTNWSIRKVGSASLYRMAKSRWEVRNQAFNDSKTRYGLEHAAHHHPQSLLANALLTVLAITLERLFRLRYLKRGPHQPRPAIAFFETCVSASVTAATATPAEIPLPLFPPLHPLPTPFQSKPLFSASFLGRAIPIGHLGYLRRRLSPAPPAHPLLPGKRLPKRLAGR